MHCVQGLNECILFAGHIVYVLQSSPLCVFTGDHLFVGGTGKQQQQNNNNSIFTCPVQLCGCVHVKALKGWNKKVDVGLYTVCTGMYAHSLVDATYREAV